MTNSINQALEQAVNEMNTEFVERVASCKDVSELHKMKALAVDPDERELIQSRIDFIYRENYK